MVSIPHWYDYKAFIAAILNHAGFNSTLVMIITVGDIIQCPGIAKFQFHTGTIITYIYSIINYNCCLVSIPHWYDYNPLPSTNHVIGWWFQFHTVRL